MRIASSLLLASVAVATCVSVMSTSEVSGPKPIIIGRLASARLATNTHSTATVNRLLRASVATDEEDRMTSLPASAVTSIRSISELKSLLKKGGKPLSKLNKLPAKDVKDTEVFLKPVAKPPMSKECEKMLALASRNVQTLRELDDKVIQAYRLHLFTELQSPLLRLDEAVMSGQAGFNDIVYHARDYDSKCQVEKATTMFEMDGLGWIAGDKSIKDVFSLLELKKEEVKIFATPKLEVLKMYIVAYNEKHKTTFTLLDGLIKGFAPEVRAEAKAEAKAEGEAEGEAIVARLLSFVSLSSIYREKAGGLQDELFDRWLADGVSADGVIEKLGIKKSGSKSLLLEDLSTIDQYISWLNERRPGETPDLFTCLKAHLGDRVFAIRVAELEAIGEEVSEGYQQLFESWLKTKTELPNQMYMRTFYPEDADEVLSLNTIMWKYGQRWKEQNEPKEPPRDASELSRKANKRGKPRSAKRTSK